MARVVLCVSGGIAAYKAPEIVRALRREEHDVQVVLTAAARAFVTELSLASVSGREVRSELFDVHSEGRIGHIDIADWAEIVLVAPATADLLAKAAHGLACDLVTTILLATRAPVLWAPAMNTHMWQHPATRANLRLLQTRGARFIGPDRGELACGWIGEGKMVDPEQLAREVTEAAMYGDAAPLQGRRILISAGPTRAYIDPVRFITNGSTGEMGFELARAAQRLGAETALVSGPVDRPTPLGVRVTSVETADQMFSAMDHILGSEAIDAVAMVAAVADIAPTSGYGQKLDKTEMLEALPRMAWRPEIDVLTALTRKHGGKVRFLGFAAQTLTGEEGGEDEKREALITAGVAKMRAKGCDAIFANAVGIPGQGFSSPTNAGYLIMAPRPKSPQNPTMNPRVSPAQEVTTRAAGYDIVAFTPVRAKSLLARELWIACAQQWWSPS